jgi:hypothetical protein
LTNMQEGIKPTRFIKRAIAAIILAALTLATLYLIPRAIQLIIDQSNEPLLQTLLPQILNPVTPTIGVIISALVFATIIFRKTKVEGPMLILLGISLIGYSYILFHGGSISIPIPPTILQNVIGDQIPLDLTANVTIGLTTFMLASMITSFLIILKGTILAYLRFKTN